MNEKKYTFSFMEDISLDSRIYPCCSFEENTEYAIQSFDSLFTQFTPTTTLSYLLSYNYSIELKI